MISFDLTPINHYLLHSAPKEISLSIPGNPVNPGATGPLRVPESPLQTGTKREPLTLQVLAKFNAHFHFSSFDSAAANGIRRSLPFNEDLLFSG